MAQGRHHQQQRIVQPSSSRSRAGAAVIHIPPLNRRRSGGEKPRQEICALLKWTCFLINFLIFLLSVSCLALGIYLCLKDPRPVTEPVDFLLNPALLFTVVGLAAGIVSLFGLFGALRDNVCLLKLFSLFVFLCYAILVVLTFAVFTLFYTDAVDEFSIQSILLYSIRRYHTNRNIADIVDYAQEQLECCGAASTAQGFRDWQLSEQFNCSPSNPYPERCGVPFSCCRRAVVSEAGGNVNPLYPAIRSLQCWQNAQKKADQEVDNDIFTSGCLQPLRSLFERHAVHLGMFVVAIIIPVTIGVCFSQCLAKQIDYQRYLLRREQRRFERRERRERQYQQQLTNGVSGAYDHGRKRSSSCLVEQGGRSQSPLGGAAVPAVSSPKRRPPNIPPPPTPNGFGSLEDDVALATAIAASKREFERERRRRRSDNPSSKSPENSSPKKNSSPKNSPNKGFAPANKLVENGAVGDKKKPHKKAGKSAADDQKPGKGENSGSPAQQQSRISPPTLNPPPPRVVPLPTAPPAPHYWLQQSHFS